MDQEQAQKQYMEILRSWPGYGSTLFDVEVRWNIAVSFWGLRFCKACLGKGIVHGGGGGVEEGAGSGRNETKLHDFA